MYEIESFTILQSMSNFSNTDFFSPVTPNQKFYANHTCNLLMKSQEVLVNSQGSKRGKEISKQSKPGLVSLLRESILSL